MSWDVLIINASAEYKAISDMPDDFSNPLGSFADVLALVRSLFDDLDLTDPSWGILARNTYSIEFSIGKDDPVETMALHVRGTDDAVRPIADLCQAGGWRAIDFSTGEFLDFAADPAASLRAWRRYADEIIADAQAKGAVVQTNPRFGGVMADALVTYPSSKRWWQFWK